MASRGVNKVIVIGNLGQNPEVRYTQRNEAIANLSVATSESWKDKNTGEQKEITEWHRCVAYKRLAEIAGEYLKKGSKVYIEGRLQTRKWQGQDGVERYTTEIVIKDLQMLDGINQGGQNSQQDYRGHSGSNQQNPTSGSQGGYMNHQAQYAQQQQQAQNNQQSGQQSMGGIPDGDFDDDIPF